MKKNPYEWTEPKRSVKLKITQKEMNNPILSWSRDLSTRYKLELDKTAQSNYSNFDFWTVENGYKKHGRNNFYHLLLEARPDLYFDETNKSKGKVLREIKEEVDINKLLEEIK